ncbi:MULTISPECIES: SCP2 sterol-binding domain-containing protein [Bacillaceae]|uniref:SCP2 sterol-binding domain-containing protein n=1 Tax=Bacillaceae TaxID=186817 RepID=UPI00047B1C5D|nr:MULTISPECIES: SCP2 sterol-binding domain-containing protein [Bacillaceae]MCM3440010.1 SCP2 sterol-binding domain-containing protein [Metabacillus halosaccharovorans]
MFLTDFISSLNKADFIKPILMNRKLIVEVRPKSSESYYLELSSKGSSILAYCPQKVDFFIEGGKKDLEDMIKNNISMKQLLSFGSISIKGSYRDFLKLDALIKLR